MPRRRVPVDLDTVRRLYLDGLPYDVIAGLLDVSVSVIRMNVARLQLPSRGRGLVGQQKRAVWISEAQTCL